MPDDDNDDEIASMQFFDEDGNPITFTDMGDAAQKLRPLLDDGAYFELHLKGCDGRDGCDCDVEIVTSDELFPKASA